METLDFPAAIEPGVVALAEEEEDVELELMDALLAMPNVEPTDARSHTQHRNIADAIAAGDPNAARTTMEAHLLQSLKRAPQCRTAAAARTIAVSVSRRTSR